VTDDDGTGHEKALCDGNVIMPGVVTSNVGIPTVNLRPRHRSRSSQ
jgi:hypothetical protein